MIILGWLGAEPDDRLWEPSLYSNPRISKTHANHDEGQEVPLAGMSFKTKRENAEFLFNDFQNVVSFS